MTETRKAAVGSGGQRQSLRAAGSFPPSHSTISAVYAQGRIVGRVRGDAFIKRVRRSIHMLQKPPSWAFDIQSLLDAQKVGATYVELHDVETHIVYTARIETINKRGFAIERGCGRQIALPLRFFETRSEHNAAAKQLSLFSEMTR